MQGLHLTADLYACQCGTALMINADTLAALCTRAIESVGLTLVDQKFHTFPSWQGHPGGVTGAVMLAESHVALHTWPERAEVTLDVYVCNFSTNNSSKAERLLDDLITAFAPGHQITNRILRGSKDADGQSDELLLEWTNPNSAHGFRVERRIETRRTPYQMLEVLETPQWGKLLRLDGCYMSSERDEFHYHEPMVHTAALAHPAPRSALVIGGGDGGAVEELLKHPAIERVTLVELDAAVIDVAREHLAAIHRGCFDDPRVQVCIDDGAAYVAREAAQPGGARFDLAVLDLTDPDTPARALYTAEFFARLRSLLTPDGMVTLHIGSPIYRPERVRHLVMSLRSVFPIVRPFGVFVPLYGSYWGMACASGETDPAVLTSEEVEHRLQARGIGDLQYLNGDAYRALFALPNYYRALVR